MDIRIELISIPVTDIDRAIAFYTEQLGFTLDHDHRVGDDNRFVQITPPGSACSIMVEPSAGRVTVNGGDFRSAAAPMAELGVLHEAKAVHTGRSAGNHLLALAQTNGIKARRVDGVIDIGLQEVADQTGRRVLPRDGPTPRSCIGTAG